VPKTVPGTEKPESSGSRSRLTAALEDSTARTLKSQGLFSLATMRRYPDLARFEFLGRCAQVTKATAESIERSSSLLEGEVPRFVGAQNSSDW
jgi:hypothetical protein